jgi:hypothetical protein
VYQKRIRELKQALMDDDCYLPWNVREVPALSRQARLTASHGDPEPLRNGLDRPIGSADNGWTAPLGSWVEYAFGGVRKLTEARLVFDSDLDRVSFKGDRNARTAMRSSYALSDKHFAVPQPMTRAFRVEALGANGQWTVVARKDSNYQRLVRMPLAVDARAVRFIPEATWGAPMSHLFAFDVK